ncbi:MAG: hypothetical protein AB7O57_06895 [Hyphomicrobiaceae bacterium]
MPARCIRRLAALRLGLAIAVLVALGSTAGAQTGPEPQAPPQTRPADGIVRRGDAVATGFAATRAPGQDLPPDVHPLDRTMIDPEGVTVRVFDLTQLGGGPEGQLSDAPVRHVVKAKDIGHVFGIAFDGDGTDGAGPPNVYLGATSVHGLQLVAPGADGKPQRIITGRPGATWMPGQFGDAKGGGPGSVWRIDGRTGAVTLFADIRNGDLENSGAGLGGIAFDPGSRHLYASDLETGLVWRLDLTGRLIDTFDHGTEGRGAAGLAPVPYDPASRTDRTEATFNTEAPETWGFATPERRVWGLAVEGGRLYYAVAEGPAVWSVPLAPDGSFAGDARLEVQVKDAPPDSQISGLVLDGPGVMYLALRGAPLGSYDYDTFMRPQEAPVLRYAWSDAERRWSETAEEYAVGLPSEHRGGAGGVALNYGYDRFGRIDYDRCRQTLWTSGERLRAGSDIVRVARGGPRLVDGLQGIYKSRVRPANEPPFEAWYVDYDASYAEAEVHGHVGNVAIYGPCKGSVTYSADRVEIPVWSKGPNLVVEKSCRTAPLGGRVRCTIRVRNTGDAAADGIVSLLDETRILIGPGKGGLVPVAEALPDGTEWACGPTPAGAFACKLPAAMLAPGAAREIVLAFDLLGLAAGGNFGFRNCVSIDHPAGKGKACAEGGTGLLVSKTGPAHCEPGQGCTFQLTLTNAGTEPFEGDVLLADHLKLGGAPASLPIVKIEPPLACATPPAALPLSCLTKVTLVAGESLTHAVTVAMPANSPAIAVNCFAVLDAGVAGKPGLVADLLAAAQPPAKDAAIAVAHPACAAVKLGKLASPARPLPPAAALLPLAGAFAPASSPPVSLTCANGRLPLAGGRCPCPLSAPYDPATGACRTRPVCWDTARLAPDGGCCPRGTVWLASLGTCRVPPVSGCHDPWRRQPDGRCCPAGQRWRDGACRVPVVAEPCRPGHVRLPSGICGPRPGTGPVVELPRCPDGRARLPSGRCPPVACPLNAPFDPVAGRCRPLSGEPCPPGLVRRTHTNRCVAPDRLCPGRMVQDAAGRCVPRVLSTGGGLTPCPPGERRIGGRCTKAPAGPVIVPPVQRREPPQPPAVRRERVAPSIVVKPLEVHKRPTAPKAAQPPARRATPPPPRLRNPPPAPRKEPVRRAAPSRAEEKGKARSKGPPPPR